MTFTVAYTISIYQNILDVAFCKDVTSGCPYYVENITCILKTANIPLHKFHIYIDLKYCPHHKQHPMPAQQFTRSSSE